MIAQMATDSDGPYYCRKCGRAVLTVSVRQCPACLDNHPWFSYSRMKNMKLKILVHGILPSWSSMEVGGK